MEKDGSGGGGGYAMQEESGSPAARLLAEKEYERLKALATDLFKKKKYLESVEYYDQASAVIYSNSKGAEEDPVWLSYYVVCKNNAAQCCINMSNFEGAIKYASEALLKDPKNAKALYRRGISFEAVDQWERALNDLKIALELDPSNKEIEKEKSKAEMICNREVEYSRLKALATDLFKEKKYLEAIEYFNQASAVIYSNSKGGAKEDPVWLSYYVVCKNNAAQCCINMSNFEGAIKYASEALLKDPKNAKALYRRGISYLASNGAEMALNDLKIALELDPSNKETIEKEIKKAANEQLFQCAVSGTLNLKEYDRLSTLGADIDFKESRMGYSALLIACELGHTKIVELLLSKFANLNIKDKKGFSALMIACKKDDVRFVKLLLSKGAKVSDKNDEGRNSLHVACQFGNIGIIRLLLSEGGVDVNDRTYQGVSPLHIAVQNNHVGIIELLLSRAADIDHKDECHGQSPLMAALFRRHTNIVKLLLSKGASFNDDSKDAYGQTCNFLSRSQDDMRLVLRIWPLTMMIVVFQELLVYNCISDSLYDFQQYI